jgi:pyruvate formate lyase activating enzyme
MWVRFVLVPGLSDDADNVRRIASFTASLGNVERVEVLPFHQLGQFKWQKLGMPYQLAHTEPPTADAVNEAVRLFKAEGVTAF